MSSLATWLADLDTAGLARTQLNGHHVFLCPSCRFEATLTETDSGHVEVSCAKGCARGRIVDSLHSLVARGGTSSAGPEEPAADKNAADPSGTAQVSPAGRRVVLTPASAITPERLRWLWQHRLPLRGLSIIAGEPGLGKSTLTVELAAQISRGKLDGEMRGKPRDVLVATAEDHFASVVWGRLTAAGADMDRVHHVHVEGDGGEMLTLPDDVAGIEARCEELTAAGRPVGLVSVDPVAAFIASGVDTHRDAAVRRVLAPLSALAERQDLSVTGVAHLNKNDSAKLLARLGGSGAFGAAPRSVLVFARDPDDPDGDQGSLRVIVQVKSNHGRFAPTLQARIDGCDVAEVGELSRLTIIGETDIGSEDLERGRDDNGGDCEEALTAALAAGPRPGREVKGTVSGELGCSKSTIERAARRMRERGELTIEKSGFPPTTTWALTGHTGFRSDVHVTPVDVNGEPDRDVNGANRAVEPDPVIPFPVHVTVLDGDVNGAGAVPATDAEEAEALRLQAKFGGAA